MPASLNLTELGSTIADGTPIDWISLEKTLDPAARGVIRQLRLVERIAQAHAILPPAASFTESLRGSTLGSQESGHPPADTPTTWGPLTIIERIGRGTFGDVYRARDPRLDRPVALKLLRRRNQHADEIESTVIEEGRLAARVKHPNIVTVYGAERINGRVGLWMEFIDGRTLEEELRERGPLPTHDVATIGIDLCRALEAIHRAGLLHRDVKAQNVMRDADGRIVLADFGSGRDLEMATSPAQELAGTPLYLAPEVLAGGPASMASDVYSVGVLLYHLATGSFPVPGRSLADLREAHARGATPESAGALSGVPGSLASVVSRALAPDPSSRFASAAELEHELSVCLVRPSRRWWFAAAAAIVGICTLAGFSTWRAARPTSTERLAFKPRDLVLISRFDNRTAEEIFDGAIEYALERELTSSDIVGLVPRERVEDTLQLMKRPTDTIVDRAVGREVCLRDGHIKALLSGRVEKFGSTYVLTTELVDPADNASLATVSEDIVGLDGIAAGLHREASAIRLALGEQRDRLHGGDPKVEPAATKSLRAFQLYNQSYQLGRENNWGAALEVAHRVVVEDPDFASGWVWLAWATRNSEMRSAIPESDESKIAKVRPHYRPFLDQALALVDSVPTWERYWIQGSYRTLLGDSEGSVPMYQALLKIRPDHFYGANNLANAFRRLNRDDELVEVNRLIADQRPNDLGANYTAASDAVSHGNITGAQPFVDRVRQLLKGEPLTNPARVNTTAWLTMLPVYVAWNSGDVTSAWRQLQAIDHDASTAAPALRNIMANDIGWFQVSLGRLRDALATFARTSNLSNQHSWRFMVADIGGDIGRMREELRQFDANNRPILYLHAGLVEEARRNLARKPAPEASLSLDSTFLAIGRGELALRDGQPAKAIAPLREGLALRSSGRAGILEYNSGCEALGTALESLGRRGEAIATLESCAAERPSFVSGNFRAPFWMRLKVHLAETYRRAERIADAEAQEAEVRKLMAAADPDHPLLKRLNKTRP